ncbi:hypothetical protein [Glutamicibacter sp.]|uniref:hypothetical protein n=1 Tax=Glutamicibacter sp. TaxID=1931995 RepID=UPI003D6C5735
MGADEKHAATYHGGEYTPDAEQVRASFANSGMHRERPVMKAGFDRWLETVRAEAKAEALNEAAENIHEIDGREDAMASRWLRACANQYKGEPANGR